MVCDRSGIPLAMVSAGANRHDSPLLEPTIRAVPDMVGPLQQYSCGHLDRGYDSAKTRALLEELGYDCDIARKDVPAPIQAGKR